MAALDCMIPRATLRAVNHRLADPRETIRSGQAILGIELGSTRIKAALIAPETTPLAAGSHTWENRFENGLWTYALADIEAGLASSVAALVEDVRTRFAIDLDANGELLVPFRTWRNNITGQACAELTPRIDFAVPQRWTVAHLYQSVLDEQPHVGRIAHLTTLAGYVHWRLTGEHLVG